MICRKAARLVSFVKQKTKRRYHVKGSCVWYWMLYRILLEMYFLLYFSVSCKTFSNHCFLDLSGAISILPDCKESTSSEYKGYKSWTRNGLFCQAWNNQNPHGHLYPLSDGPFCR